MKRTKFSNWKTLFLLLGFITLWSCQQDDNIEIESNKSSLTVSKINFEQFSKENKAFKIINKINKSDIDNKRIIYNPDFDFYINTDEVFFIEDNTVNYHSYSFNIIRNNPVDNNVECLLLSLNSESEYDVYIVKYSFTSEEYNNLSENELENHQTSFTKINFDLTQNNILQKSNMPGWTCDETWELIQVTQPTYQGEVRGQENLYENTYSWTVSYTNCRPSTGGGSGSGGSGSSGGASGGPGGGSSGGSSGGYNGYLPIVTTPVVGNDTNVPLISNFINNLDYHSKIWWNNTATTEQKESIINYLFLNNFNNQSQEFAEEVINAGISNTLISAKPFFKYPENSNYATLYPNFTEIVQDNIPFLASQYSQISQIISGITGVSVQQVMQDLQWGYGAEIVIEQLGVNSYGDEIKGLFNPSNPKTIKIDIDLVNLYENANESDIAPLQLLITFSTLLHELVHYEDYQFDNIMQNDIELGLYFEYLYMGGYYELDDNNNVIFIIEN